MKSYNVTVSYITDYNDDNIEAESEIEAIEILKKMIDDKDVDIFNMDIISKSVENEKMEK